MCFYCQPQTFLANSNTFFIFFKKIFFPASFLMRQADHIVLSSIYFKNRNIKILLQLTLSPNFSKVKLLLILIIFILTHFYYFNSSLIFTKEQILLFVQLIHNNFQKIKRKFETQKPYFYNKFFKSFFQKYPCYKNIFKNTVATFSSSSTILSHIFENDFKKLYIFVNILIPKTINKTSGFSRCS